MTNRSARVELAYEDGVAHLRLTRPEAGNAFDEEFGAAFLEAVTALGRRDEVRSVLVSAQGPHFCAGGDIKHFATTGGSHLGDRLAALAAPYHEALVLLGTVAVPVVAAVRGACYGPGFGLLGVSDVVVASETATFCTGFAHLGLPGDGGCTWFLPRLVGPRRARRMTLLNETVDARRAEDWGLVSMVVEDEVLDESAQALARRLARGPTAAFAAMKHLLGEAPGADLAPHLAAEIESMRLVGQSNDAAEAITAFVERRKPTFTGF